MGASTSYLSGGRKKQTDVEISVELVGKSEPVVVNLTSSDGLGDRQDKLFNLMDEITQFDIVPNAEGIKEIVIISDSAYIDTGALQYLAERKNELKKFGKMIPKLTIRFMCSDFTGIDDAIRRLEKLSHVAGVNLSYRFNKTSY